MRSKCSAWKGYLDQKCGINFAFRKRRLENDHQPSSEENKSSEVKLMQYDATPDFIVGKMHDYQIRGLNWLISLCENGIGGILGDEMGLGESLIWTFY